MIYVLMLGIAIFWKRAVLGNADLALYHVDLAIIVAFVGIIALLSSRWTIPLGWLKVLELGIIAVMASRLAFVQHRLMLIYSLRDDRMMAQLTMKNIVLLTSILILTYGLYVPKSWRRCAWWSCRSRCCRLRRWEFFFSNTPPRWDGSGKDGCSVTLLASACSASTR